LQFRFIIGQTGEPFVLERIKDILGFGAIYKEDLHNHFRFASGLESADKIKEYLDKYPLRSIKSIDLTR